MSRKLANNCRVLCETKSIVDNSHIVGIVGMCKITFERVNNCAKLLICQVNCRMLIVDRLYSNIEMAVLTSVQRDRWTLDLAAARTVC
jgi:hypothetical protein